MRIGGLATGLDTDTIVKQMLAREQAKVDKFSGKSQILQWQQEMYREFASSIKGVKDKYFDVLNRSTYTFNKDFFSSVTANIVGTDKGLISVKPTNTAKTGRYSVKVTEIATGAKATSKELEIAQGEKVSLKTELSKLTNNGKLNIKLNDGTSVTIKLEDGKINDKVATMEDLVNEISNHKDLKGKVNISYSEITGKLNISTTEVGKGNGIEISGSLIDALGFDSDSLDKLLYSERINVPSLESGKLQVKNEAARLSTKLEDLGFTVDTKIKVNGKEITLIKSDTLEDVGKKMKEADPSIKSFDMKDGVISIIGTDTAEKIELSAEKGVLNNLGLANSDDESAISEAKYDINFKSGLGYDKFNNLELKIDGKEIKLDSKPINNIETLNENLKDKLGHENIKFVEEDGKIVLTSTKSFNIELSLTDSTDSNEFYNLAFDKRANIVAAKDASINVTLPNGDSGIYTSSKNNFTVDGLNFDIKGITSEEIIFNVESNVDKSVENIKEFVKMYNELIDSIGSKVYEKKQYKYSPLTDTQKEAMTEKQIEKWEEQAKQGIIRNDPALNKFLTDMRQAFYENVKGVGVTLSDIGITTSANYTSRGKLVIDETKLRTALTERPDDVAELFIKDSSNDYDRDKGYSGNTERMKEVGIFRRLSDIIEDTIRTGRNSQNQKGSLLEKAGVKGDITEIENIISKQIKDNEKTISDLIKKMQTRETQLYKQFTYLETMMNNYNSQSSWLTQQLGGM